MCFCFQQDLGKSLFPAFRGRLQTKNSTIYLLKWHTKNLEIISFRYKTGRCVHEDDSHFSCIAHCSSIMSLTHVRCISESQQEGLWWRCYALFELKEGMYQKWLCVFLMSIKWMIFINDQWIHRSQINKQIWWHSHVPLPDYCSVKWDIFVSLLSVWTQNSSKRSKVIRYLCNYMVAPNEVRPLIPTQFHFFLEQSLIF